MSNGTPPPVVITPIVQGGVMTVRVPEESQSTIAVTLPVPLASLTSLQCTVIDMDDPNACGIAPYIQVDALPWLNPDPATATYVSFPLQPPATSLRWGPPNFYERRRAVFAWQGTDPEGASLTGVTELAIDVWSVVGVPGPAEACETPPPPPPPIVGRAAHGGKNRASLYVVPKQG